MALKVSGFSSTALDYKIVYFDNQSSPTAAIQENVTGASGRWYSVDIDNKSGSSVYVKMSDGFAPTLGTTTPGWVYQVKPQTAERIEIPTGVPFTSALNVWTTLNPEPLDTTVPATNGVIVTVVCS